ncbi:hypothetical protein ACTXT7_009856 [Hymenolepis weldensis]
MSDELRPSSVDTVEDAMDRDNEEKDIPAHIKKAFDNMRNLTWHYIVDRNFGSNVTHEVKHFNYFSMGSLAILLTKSG